ncbi:hypothetical protein PM8797T_01734 [Gimesia maris DSM 8797]|nr:hypothetical protein PM8797T_01734 [Gimesia maris DSM 8797]
MPADLVTSGRLIKPVAVDRFHDREGQDISLQKTRQQYNEMRPIASDGNPELVQVSFKANI